MGTVRLPAAWTGVATLKPSNRRIPLDNPYFGRSADPLARMVADVALGTHAVARPDERDYTSPPDADIDWLDIDTDVRGRRIAMHTDPGAGMPVDPEVRAAVLRAADLFTDAGAEVVELPAFIDDGILRDIDYFWRIRFWRTYLGLSHEAKTAVLPYIAEWVHPGSDMTGRRALEAYETFGDLQKRTVAATSAYDAVLAPVAPVAAFPAEWPMPWGFDASLAMPHIAFTLTYNMSGQPASSVNCGFTADGRPIGLQISGRRFADLETLRLTAWYEGARPVDAVRCSELSIGGMPWSRVMARAAASARLRVADRQPARAPRRHTALTRRAFQSDPDSEADDHGAGDAVDRASNFSPSQPPVKSLGGEDEDAQPEAADQHVHAGEGEPPHQVRCRLRDELGKHGDVEGTHLRVEQVRQSPQPPPAEERVVIDRRTLTRRG